MKEKIKTILMIGFICIVVTSSVNALGFGIVPLSFTIDEASSGGTYDQTLMIVNVDNDTCNYEFEGTDDIGAWVCFYAVNGLTAIDTIEVPGKSRGKIIARFSIPNETTPGKYTGVIYVQTIPKTATGGGGAAADVVLRMPSQGTIIVADLSEDLSGIVTNITAMDTEVNNTLRVKVEFKNTGDVIATPAINVTIATNESLIVDCIYHNKTAVMPGANETIPVEWDTTGQIPGNYSLNVSVSLDTDVLATKNLTVMILPPGTLARAGDLTAMTSEGELSTGQTVKIVATFENTGAIDTNASFVAEVYIDGNLTGEINSDDLIVPVGEVSNLTALLDLAIPGDYEITGHVLYDGKSTDTKELSFSVTKAESAET